jgi:hypothetical protein
MMSDVSVRAKWMFWALALAAFFLAAVPSAIIIEKARDYYRFVTGWQPGTLKQLHVRRLPVRDSLDEDPPPDIRFVEFSLLAPKARSVRLGGSFNQWLPQFLPLSRKGRFWRVIVPLPPGRYEYAFELDGVWTPDPKLPEKSVVGGREVSILHVR